MTEADDWGPALPEAIEFARALARYNIAEIKAWIAKQPSPKPSFEEAFRRWSEEGLN